MAGPTRAERRPVVLVAEDDEALRKMIAHLLADMVEVQLAADGLEALGMVQSGPLPDLLITDLMMPRMDGLTLVKRLRADAKLSRIPVIMLTAKSSPKDVVTGINSGARHYLTKPFKRDELLDKVKKALRLS